MKKLFAVVLLFLIVAQLYLLPMSVQAIPPPCASVATHAATNITESSATLNGSVIIPSVLKNTSPNGMIPVSLQYADHEPIQVFVSFQCGTTPGVYTHETPQIMMIQSGTFQATITGLPPCTTHYARTKIHTTITQNSFDLYPYRIQGAGVGVDYNHLQQLVDDPIECPDLPGNIVSFDTIGCQTYIGTGSHGSGGMPGFGSTPPPSNPPIVGVSSAAVASTRVSPGEKVDVSATISNKGGSSGTSKVTLFINGQEEESKGITLASGDSTTVHFSVSRNDPGIYTAYVNSIPAGSFTVDQFKNNDALIYGVIALFIIGIAGILYLLIRKRTA